MRRADSGGDVVSLRKSPSPSRNRSSRLEIRISNLNCGYTYVQSRDVKATCAPHPMRTKPECRLFSVRLIQRVPSLVPIWTPSRTCVVSSSLLQTHGRDARDTRALKRNRNVVCFLGDRVRGSCLKSRLGCPIANLQKRGTKPTDHLESTKRSGTKPRFGRVKDKG